jgi:hypothetical protein
VELAEKGGLDYLVFEGLGGTDDCARAAGQDEGSGCGLRSAACREHASVRSRIRAAATKATPPTSRGSPSTEKDYPLLVERVTAERVVAHFVAIAMGPVTRYEMPNIGAFIFVIEGAFSGGVTLALTLEGYGNSLSLLMLDLEIWLGHPPPGRRTTEYLPFVY